HCQPRAVVDPAGTSPGALHVAAIEAPRAPGRPRSGGSSCPGPSAQPPCPPRPGRSPPRGGSGPATAGAGSSMSGISGIDPATRLCALLGDPVSHSGSPAMHNAAFAASGTNAAYLAFQVSAAGFD